VSFTSNGALLTIKKCLNDIKISYEYYKNQDPMVHQDIRDVIDDILSNIDVIMQVIIEQSSTFPRGTIDKCNQHLFWLPLARDLKTNPCVWRSPQEWSEIESTIPQGVHQFATFVEQLLSSAPDGNDYSTNSMTRVYGESTSASQPQQTRSRFCPTCGQPLTWIPHWQRWYCYNEKKYV
jgi:hypothetical protein